MIFVHTASGGVGDLTILAWDAADELRRDEYFAQLDVRIAAVGANCSERQLPARLRPLLEPLAQELTALSRPSCPSKGTSTQTA